MYIIGGKKIIKNHIKRPILVITLGYICGILWGLYIHINIILFFIILISIFLYFVFKVPKKSKKKFSIFNLFRYFRYIKLFINRKTLILFLIVFIFSNINVKLKEQKYNNKYKDNEILSGYAIVVSDKKEKEFYDIYKIKDLKSHNLFYIKINKKQKLLLAYGDKIKYEANYQKPSKRRNYGGFDYQNYLKTLKIYGTLKPLNIKVISKNQGNKICLITNKLKEKIEKKIDNYMPNKNENAEILKGLLLGDISNISEETQENFKVSNLSHVLAVSGMQVNYIIRFISVIFSKLIGKNKTRILTIFILIFYMSITGFSPSIVRATFMGILLLISLIVHRKNNFWNSISLSLLIILIYNPFLILNVGLILSYLGTIGIIALNKTIFDILDNIKIKNNKLKYKIDLQSKKMINIKKDISVILSAQLMIFPFIIYSFNIIGMYFLITNLLANIIIEPITLLGISTLILSFISIKISKFFSCFLNLFINFLCYITKFSELPFSKIYIPTPKVYIVILLYISIFIFSFVCEIYIKKNLNQTQKRIRNLIAMYKYFYKLHKRKINFILIFIIIFLILLNQFSRKLEINFVDIGQGDCTFIITPHNKTILIDGGGNDSKNFDGGENTLIPYILDKGYNKIDLMVISHFDSDHVGNLLSVLKELKVKKVIISKQEKDSENYQNFLKIVNKKKIKVKVVKKGDILKIERNIKIKILWPQQEQIQENILNNNSIVLKLEYKKFSMLFTGDIEKIAENEIVNNYDSKVLNSNILKVAHHGSKTSSTEKFIKLVNPQLAVIGVGKNNLFNHPSNITLETLKNNNVKIYRTDENGEITIKVRQNGNYKIRKMF